MDETSQEFLNMSFRLSIPSTPEEFTVNQEMLKILLEIDESKPLSQVAQDAGVSPSNLKQNITKLLNLSLIEALEKKNTYLDENFFKVLKQALLLAVGPLADLILEDALADMEASISDFPAHMAAGLINILTAEIPREEKRTEFLKVMIPKIPK